jgi:hypothetical protein
LLTHSGLFWASMRQQYLYRDALTWFQPWLSSRTHSGASALITVAHYILDPNSNNISQYGSFLIKTTELGLLVL